jgi:cytochrome c oxidase cbb3-type subunit III
MQPRLICILLALAPISLPAQDHPNEPAGKAAATPPEPNPAQTKQGPGRGKGGGGGGRGGDSSAAVAEMNKILAAPAELEKGRKLFETHCSTCHGPKGEGSRGPTLAQPSLPRAGDDPSLVRIVQSGIPGTEMPRVTLQTGEAPYIAAYVRSLGRIPVENVPGDPAKGAELFNTKGACLACHTRDGQGLAIGPDLTSIGRKRSAAFLRRSLVDPGAEVPQSYDSYRADISMPLNFLFVRAKTKDGKEVAGIRVNEDSYSIQLRDLTGAIHSYYKKELAELHKDKGVSPMPVYGALLAPAELDDLVAYLVSLRGEKQ